MNVCPNIITIMLANLSYSELQCTAFGFSFNLDFVAITSSIYSIAETYPIQPRGTHQRLIFSLRLNLLSNNRAQNQTIDKLIQRTDKKAGEFRGRKKVNAKPKYGTKVLQ